MPIECAGTLMLDLNATRSICVADMGMVLTTTSLDSGMLQLQRMTSSSHHTRTARTFTSLLAVHSMVGSSYL